MHPLVKTSAVAMAVCGLMGSSSAWAANCLPGEDNEALHVASVRQQLIVANSACPEISARYGQFLQRYQPDLQASDATLVGFFTRHNPQSGAADLNTFKAKLAYIASLHLGRERVAFCQQATQMLIGALNGRATLGRFAATQPVEFQMPYVACEAKPPAASLTASAQGQQAAPASVVNRPVVVASNHDPVKPAITAAPVKPAPMKVASVPAPVPVPVPAAAAAPASKPAPIPAPPRTVTVRPNPQTQQAMPRLKPAPVPAAPKTEVAANLPVHPAIMPAIKPVVPDVILEAPRKVAVPERRPARVAILTVQAPILPKVKPAPPADAPHVLARADRSEADGNNERVRPRLRVAVQLVRPPIFPTAKPIFARPRPVAIARIVPREAPRPVVQEHFAPRPVRDERVASGERHERTAMAPERNRAARIARNYVRPEPYSFRDRRVSPAPRHKLDAPPPRIALARLEPQRNVQHKDDKTASRTSADRALADIDQILARLTAPVVTPASAHPATPAVQAASATIGGSGYAASADKFATQTGAQAQPQAKGPDHTPAAAYEGAGNGDVSSERTWADDQPQRRNGPPPWAHANRNATVAQNDDDEASSQSDDDQGPPVRFRGRNRRTWDSFRGRDSYAGGPRWEQNGDDDDQSDDDSAGYGPPERDERFRGAWY